MFPIPLERRVRSDLPLITEAYEVLHFDQVPILFTGLNLYRNRVVGSSVDEDHKEGIERFFHAIVRPETYSRFIRREISYRDVLIDSQTVFVIDQALRTGTMTVAIYDVQAIPEEYFPSERSFCPVRASDKGTFFGERYQIALDGRWSFEEFGKLPHLYIQIYSAVYALDLDRRANHGRIETAIQSYPWRGGFSSVNFFTVLHNAVPRHDRPRIAAMQYASPGFVELALAADVATRIRELVLMYLEHALYWEQRYKVHYEYMGRRAMLRDGADIEIEELTDDDRAVLDEATDVMAQLWGSSLTATVAKWAPTPVVRVKVLHSMYRRLRQLAQFQLKHLASF